MEDQQKARLMLISVAGVALIGAGGWWVMSQNSKTEKAEEQANSAGIPKQPGPGQPANPAADSAANPAGTPAANPAGTPAANPAGTPAANPAGTPAAKTATATPGTTPGAAPPNPAASSSPPPPKGNLTALAGMGMDDSASPAAGNPAAKPIAIASAALPQAANAVTNVATAAKNKYPATRRDEAVSTAKQVAGRLDPMIGTFEKTPYPAPWTKAGVGGHGSTGDEDKDKASAAGGATVPPPPPPPTMKAAKEPPVPPPPPTTADAGSAPQLPIDNLPQPPDKPLVTPSLKLTAILGNKAILSVPLQLRTQNKWPAVICLGPGERFEDPTNGSFSVVSVDQDSVTIEEEQERSVKSLPQIK